MPDRIKIVHPTADGLVIEGNKVGTITLGMGKRGPTGPAGAAGYNHTQTSAAATWTIPHNLGFYPIVSVRNGSGVEIGAEVQNLSVDVVQVLLISALAGSARCV